MEIIGTGPLGTRSSVMRLRRKGSALEFVVFPMVHVADPRFYAEVAERLRKCDLLVVEGVTERSVLVWALTASYRVIPKNRRSGVVVDNIPYPELGVPLLRPDVTASEFGRTWRTLPLRLRLAVWCLLPVVTLVQLLGGRRRLLAPSVAVNDDDFPEYESEERLLSVFGGERDRRLLATLTDLHDARSAERISVAVVYGAAHVAPLVEGLLVTLGYRARSAEWLTVLEP
jgi:hypothetical protein